MRWVPKGAGSAVDGEAEGDGDGDDDDDDDDDDIDDDDDDDDDDEDDAADSSAGKKGGKGKKRGKGTYGRSEARAGKSDGTGAGKGGGKSGKGKGKDTAKDLGRGTSKDLHKGGKSSKSCVGKGAGKSKGELEDVSDRKDRSERAEKSNRSEDAKRQATVQKGRYTEVRKHSSIGCAVVTMQDVNIRQALLNAGPQTTIAGICVKLKPHVDRDTKQEVMTDVFVGWGRQVEKATPLSEAELVNYFDQKHDELYSSGRLEELSRRGGPPGPPPSQYAQSKDDHRALPSQQRQTAVASDPAVLAAVRPSPLSSMPAVVPPPSGPPHMPAMPLPVALPQQQSLQAQQTQQAQQAQQQAQQQAMVQAAQVQWAAQMQAHYMLMYQQQQQQHQQAMVYAAAMASHAALQGKGGSSTRKEFKPAYRRPTDEEVMAKLRGVTAPEAEAEGVEALGGAEEASGTRVTDPA